jgi:hypothetical protein
MIRTGLWRSQQVSRQGRKAEKYLSIVSKMELTKKGSPTRENATEFSLGKLFRREPPRFGMNGVNKT